MGMFGRVAGTVVVLAGWGYFSGLMRTVEPLVQGKAAVWQLKDSDAAYVAAQYGMSFGPAVTWAAAALAILLLVLIWKGPILRALRGQTGTAALALAAALLLASQPASAYYAQQNYPEWEVIRPNESAFLIPMMGANKDSQAEFGSVEYYKEKKVPTKRVQIPHYQLPKSSWTVDYWVPSEQLIIVDRTPTRREWTKEIGKGTEKADEGLRCESRDSFPVTTAITVAAYVTEENAPTFLYHFGTKAIQGKRDDPQVIFASVVEGRSLAEVLDTNVRGMIHIQLCAEMARYDLDAKDPEADLFRKKNEMIAKVVERVTALYKPMGISFEYLGLSDELTYEPEIQTAINRVFLARKEGEAAIALQPALPVLQAEADIEVKKGLATALKVGLSEGLKKGIPTLPNFVGDLGSMAHWLKDLGGAVVGPAPVTQHPVATGK